MSELTQGLTISGFGILITFSALGILIGLILLLKTLFPAREECAESDRVVDEIPPALGFDREALLKQAAAVGVSVLMHQNRSREGDLGKLLDGAMSGWWSKGLDRVHGKE